MTSSKKVKRVKAFIVDLPNLKKEGAMTIHDKRYFPDVHKYIPCTIEYTLPAPTKR